MKTYEVVREIPNSCRNNQMRDVFLQQCEFDVQPGENGDMTIFVRTGDIYQKFLFTLIEG